MKLSIAIVTWNRSEQLREAILSCLDCDLPKETEFIIIDNASTDNTESVVNDIFSATTYPYYYEKLSDNIGCGNGRNYAYSIAKGDYFYSLDDDAYIGNDNKDFFTRAISILDENPEVMTLTTQIYDLLWKQNRVTISGIIYKESMYICQRFCGGSHFLRSSFWKNTLPYYPNKYALEEIFPSLRVFDEGYLNIFVPSICIIHDPKVNKWIEGTSLSNDILCTEIICKYAMKSSIYPNLFKPILWVSTVSRCLKKLSIKESYSVLKDDRIKQILVENRNVKKISYKTVFKLIYMFKFSAF